MAFSSMDLDSSLDDLIKQRKKQNQKPAPAKKAAKQTNQKKLPIKKIQTKAKVTKPNNNNNNRNNKKKNKSINSRLSQKGPVTPTASPSKIADPSQIIITKTIPVHKPKKHNNNNNNNKNNHNHNNNNTRNNNNNISNNIYSSNDSNRKNGFRMQQQSQPELFTSFKPPLEEPRTQFSIRGRSSTVTRPTGLSIRGESGPSTVLISNLDPRTNSEDVKVSCESFGAILHCEVLRNSSGQSYGEAEVEFSSKGAALDCIAQFDNNMADGRILRAILREPKPSMSSFASKQIRSSMPAFLPSGKMYADQIGNSRYDIHRP